MKVNESFQRDWKEIENMVRAIYPEVNGTDLRFLKARCKSMVGNVLLEIGNSVNAQTNVIED